MPLFKPKKRLSLYKDGDSRDSRLMSSIIKDQITFGGVTVYAWLLEGYFSQKNDMGKDFDALDEDYNEVQDVIFGENRDRQYSDDAISLIGVYTVSQNALDFARFGIMLSDDIIQMEFHKEDMEKRCGRRLAVGDVIEMPHLRDVGADGRANNRWYEIQSIVKSPSGWDAAWNWHVMTATMRPIKDAQEFIDLMEREDQYGSTLRDSISNREKMEGLTAAIQEAAIDQAYTSWFDTSQIYIDPETETPQMWEDDLNPPNGQIAAQVSSFPSQPDDGDYVIRTDMYPKKLYRYETDSWVLKSVDRKREWGTYNWTQKLREFATDQSMDDDLRPWEYKSIHDVLTPRHDKSEPSPRSQDRGGYPPPPQVGAWSPMIIVERPIVDSPYGIQNDDPVDYTVTLTANTGAAATIDSNLDAVSGAYSIFYVQYTLTRDTGTRIGELLITDDGTNTAFKHEFNNLAGGVDLSFSVVHEGGFRKLKYVSSVGNDITMTFRITQRW